MDLFFVPLAEFRKVTSSALPFTVKASIFADLCRINVLYMIMRAGSGHLGSSYSSLDIMSWIYLTQIKPDQDSAVFFSSKGHDAPALYSVLIGLGRLDFDYLHRLRRLGGLPGHPDVATPGIVCNTGPLGMGISKAKGMVLAGRLSGKLRRIFVLTGDGELQEGQFWESMISAANRKLGEITVIVDHNKIQSDTWVRKVSDLGDLEKKFKAFGWEVFRCDGHNLNQISKIVLNLKPRNGHPKIIIADTQKGRGVSFMQNDAVGRGQRLYGFHSGAPNPGLYRKAYDEILVRVQKKLRATRIGDIRGESVVVPDPVKKTGAQSMVRAYSQALIREAGRNERVLALDADLAKDCGLLDFESRFPNRFIECGIAEQDMVSQAGALALKGYLPVVHSFASFLTQRANEQIFNNATERTKVIYVGSLAGLLPAGPGHSHQCLRDISVMSSVPGLTLIEPADENETALAVKWAIRENAGSTYIRLVTVPCQIPYRLPGNYRLRRGVGVFLRRGRDAVIFVSSPVMVSQAFLASNNLYSRFGLRVGVVNIPWLNDIDGTWLRGVVSRYDKIFTLENHSVQYGQGQMIASQIASFGTKAKVHCFGIKDIPFCGQNDEVLKAHRLDAESLTETIRLLI